MPKSRPCPRCSAQVPIPSRFCQACGAEIAANPALHPSRGPSQWLVLTAGIVAIVVVVGAILAFMDSNKAKQTGTILSSTEIPAAGPLPNWLTTADPSIVADYAWAAEHYEELRYIPCYCGCNSVGHTDNASCYYRWDKNGTILGYDAHALG